MSALTVVRKYFPSVTGVKDAKDRMKIEVTHKDESMSKKKNLKECALAIAAKRSQDIDGIVISVRTAYLVKDNVATRYFLPEHTAREIVSFDRGSGFVPGEYELIKPTTPLGTHKNGGHTKHKKRGSRPNTAVSHKTMNIRASLRDN